MPLEQMHAALEALAALSGREVGVSVESKNNNLGAYAKFSGVLGRPEIDENRVWVPVRSQFSSDDRIGFSIDAGHFESWGQMQGNVRLVADGVAILVRPVT